MDISVIICAHNPDTDHFQRVLGALKTQTLPLEQWELLVIDNASKKPLAGQWDLSWQPHARFIREKEVGLTSARLRGIEESKGKLLVFVDDDNVLQADYLKISQQISRDWPRLGAWGGQHFPDFEGCAPAEKWKEDFWTSTLSRDLWSNNYDPHATPFGAGVCVRKTVADQYAALVRSNPMRLALGRKGTGLSSAEDIDMAFVACDLGLGLGRFISLKLNHIIPKARTSDNYLLRLSEGIAYSQVILDSIRGIKTFQPRRIDRVAGFCKQLFLQPMERRMAMARESGRNRAINELNLRSQNLVK